MAVGPRGGGTSQIPSPICMECAGREVWCMDLVTNAGSSTGVLRIMLTNLLRVGPLILAKAKIVCILSVYCADQSIKDLHVPLSKINQIQSVSSLTFLDTDG